MDNFEHIDKTLDELKEIWEAVPTMRLGQFLTTIANYSVLYYIDDKQLIELLRKSYAKPLAAKALRDAAAYQPIMVKVSETEPAPKLEPEKVFEAPVVETIRKTTTKKSTTAKKKTTKKTTKKSTKKTTTKKSK